MSTTLDHYLANRAKSYWYQFDYFCVLTAALVACLQFLRLFHLALHQDDSKSFDTFMSNLSIYAAAFCVLFVQFKQRLPEHDFFHDLVKLLSQKIQDFEESVECKPELGILKSGVAFEMPSEHEKYEQFFRFLFPSATIEKTAELTRISLTRKQIQRDYEIKTTIQEKLFKKIKDRAQLIIPFLCYRFLNEQGNLITPESFYQCLIALFSSYLALFPELTVNFSIQKESIETVLFINKYQDTQERFSTYASTLFNIPIESLENSIRVDQKRLINSGYARSSKKETLFSLSNIRRIAEDRFTLRRKSAATASAEKEREREDLLTRMGHEIIALLSTLEWIEKVHQPYLAVRQMMVDKSGSAMRFITHYENIMQTTALQPLIQAWLTLQTTFSAENVDMFRFSLDAFKSELRAFEHATTELNKVLMRHVGLEEGWELIPQKTEALKREFVPRVFLSSNASVEELTAFFYQPTHSSLARP